MSQRERFLAIGVAVVVGLFGAQYLFNKVSTTLAEKQDAVDAARSESEDMDKVITSGKISVKKMEDLTRKSLPRDEEALIAQYSAWLTQLGQDVQMDPLKVTVPDRPIKTTDSYTAYNFGLQGECALDKATEVIAKFYDKDYLHKMRNLKINLSNKEPNRVQVQFDAQALSLKSAPEDQEASADSSGRLAMSISEYQEKILSRNPFSPPNESPKFDIDRSYELVQGESFRLAMKATDPELGENAVDFQLVSDEVPEGMRYRRGELSWRPQELGDYEVTVRATDRTWPKQSSDRRIRFKVVEPVEEEVKEPPKFDKATQAFVSALLSGRNGPEVWIRSRTDGNTLKLTESQDFELGNIKAKVIEINLREDFVPLVSPYEDGVIRWSIGMDISLADAFSASLTN